MTCSAALGRRLRYHPLFPPAAHWKRAIQQVGTLRNGGHPNKTRPVRQGCGRTAHKKRQKECKKGLAPQSACWQYCGAFYDETTSLLAFFVELLDVVMPGGQCAGR